MKNDFIPAVTVKTEEGHGGIDEFGMRPMQRRAYERRGEQYLLVKSPPASGKSRAVMFIALDKMRHQGIPRTVIAVPQLVIGGSFASRDLMSTGFEANWEVEPRWNLCGGSNDDDHKPASGTVQAVGDFLREGIGPLICSHATLMHALGREDIGIEAFDGSFLVIDEFHHVAANEDQRDDSETSKRNNRLGSYLHRMIQRDRAHIAALTGSYFRGDGEAILKPEDEARFEVVTYTYHEQLCDYEHLKRLDIGHRFYRGPYLENLAGALDPNLKTIVHIPYANSREGTGNPTNEAGLIIDFLGETEGTDESTGFRLIRNDETGRLLKVADLVNPAGRERVLNALRCADCATNRDHVDIIIALNMAKEGFDWVWCEHALTIGYRASMTEIVQIIGRATRDVEGKPTAKFTNMIAEPDMFQVTAVKRDEGVNDILKAIGASLLMEHVMAPKIEFLDKDSEGGARPGYNYGSKGYRKGGANVGIPDDPRQPLLIEVAGLGAATPEGKKRIKRYVDDLLPDVLSEKGMNYMRNSSGSAIAGESNEEAVDVNLRKIVRKKCSGEDASVQDMVLKHLAARINLTHVGTRGTRDGNELALDDPNMPSRSAFAKSIRKWALQVGDINVDLIQRVNPLSRGCEIMAKSFDRKTFEELGTIIGAHREKITPEEASDLGRSAVKFMREHGHAPREKSSNPFEKRMALAVKMLAIEAGKRAALKEENA